MTLHRFSLVPFPGEGPSPGVAVAGSIRRRGNALSVRFALRGRLSEISVPPPAEPPERKDRLWEGTCLELVLGVGDSTGYWEFNLSPAGHWNVYRFSAYRDGMREEPAFPSLPFRVRRESGALRLSLDQDIGAIIPAGKAVEAGVAAVVRTVGGRTSHCALVHPGPRPDFHRRDGLVLRLPPEPPGG